MKMKMYLKLFLFFFFGQVLTGCVDKIEEAAAPVSNQLDREITYFNYTGIIQANPIAHDKIEVVFERASGSPLDLEYKIFINDSEEGRSINLDSVSTHLFMRYYFIVDDLNINTLYKLRIRVFNKKNGQQSKSEQTHVVRTFNNQVADFKGIIDLARTPGSESSSIKVKWQKVPYFNPFAFSPVDPIRYEVIYSSVSPEDVVYTSQPSTTRRIEKVENITLLDHPSEFIIPGLIPNTTYYVRVRAIHRAYNNYETAGEVFIPLNREENTKFMKVTTEDAVAWTAIRRETDFQVTNSSGQAGYNTVDATWNRSLGAFFGYRLIYERITDAGDPVPANYEFEIENGGSYKSLRQLIQTPHQDQDSGFVFTGVDAEDTTKKIVSLMTSAVYRFKLYVCQNISCPIIDGGALNAIAYDTQLIRVRPLLAPFSGINYINNPVDSTKLSEIELNFDPPVLNLGWADGMKFFCVKNGNYYQLPVEPLSITGTSTDCDGLSLKPFDSSDNGLKSLKKLKVSGVLVNASKEYCFAATPYLDKNGINEPTGHPTIVRCIYPEIETPTVQEFSGLNSCTPDEDERNFTFEWSAPSRGLFTKYVIFWKKTKVNEFFSLTRAIEQYLQFNPADQNLDRPSCADNEYCFLHIDKSSAVLRKVTPESFPILPGSYDTGILTKINVNSNIFWSQINTGVKKCELPYPTATFKSFTRIFAIGPKKSKLSDTDDALREAIDQHGIPYEVDETDPSKTLVETFFRPPGQALTEIDVSGTKYVDLKDSFDGLTKTGESASSNSGIISLAWEEVTFESSVYQEVFKNSQNGGPRGSRSFGYKVERSLDNRLTWKDLTISTGLIHATTDYPLQRNRPNHTPSGTKPRMAFFTDYSVETIPNMNGNEKARVYWYRITPVFNEVTLALENPKANLVKVILPPANMALVHRWMANRAQCLELNLTPRVDSNYSCAYRGLGAIAEEGTFFESTLTKLDLNGDLLVDRFELGCNYTRGPKFISEQETLKDQNFSTLASLAVPINERKGCFKKSPVEIASSNLNPLPGLVKVSNVTIPNLPTSNTGIGKRLLIGDCIGESYDQTIPIDRCAPLTLEDSQTRIYPELAKILAPGFAENASTPAHMQEDCEDTYLSKRLGVKVTSDSSDFSSVVGSGYESEVDRYNWSKDNLAQSHFLSVYANLAPLGALSLPLVGLNSAGEPFTMGRSVKATTSNCSINLAAIHAGEYLPRWANAGFLNGSYSSTIKLSSTPLEILDNPILYQDGNFDKPSVASLGSLATTPIGKILSTNDAGALPLMGLSKSAAETICGQYKVDLVISNPEMTTILSSNNSKRLLRRREFLASNLWPESLTTSEIDFLEGVKSNKDPTDQLPGTQAGSCNHDVNSSTTYTGRWAELKNRLLSGNPFLTGSGASNRCISRFGIQDLIGNVAEYSSEYIFCDFRPLSMRYGSVDTSRAWDRTGRDLPELRLFMDPAYVDANLFGSNPGSETWTFLIKGSLKDAGGDRYFEIKNNDNSIVKSFVENNVSDPNTITHRPYVFEQINAGYCSMVDTNSTRREDPNQVNILQESDIYQDIFSKTLSSSLIPEPQRDFLMTKDPESLITLRDGLGFFLDFGDYGMASSVTNDNTLSFPWSFIDQNGNLAKTPGINDSIDPTNPLFKNVFFSTVIGVPLSCGPNFIYCPQLGSKVPYVMEEHLQEIIPPSLVSTISPTIESFYTGGSTIQNIGLREATISKNTTIVPYIDSDRVAIAGFISSLKLPADKSNTKFVDRNVGPIQQERLYIGDFEPGTEIHSWDVRWDSPRGANLGMNQGGHFNNSQRRDQANGRFSLNIRDADLTSNSGIRCGVLIRAKD